MTNESAPQSSNQPPAVQLRRDIYALLPWLHLLRAVPIAVQLRMLLLSMVGWAAILSGLHTLRILGCEPDTSEVLWGNLELSPLLEKSHSTRAALSTRKVYHLETILSNRDVTLDERIIEYLPLNSFYGSLTALLHQNHTWPELAYEWTVLLWTLLVWGLVGGAICRLAALQFARHERRGVVYALKFSFRQGLSWLIAPLLPLTGIGCLAAVNALLGLVVAAEQSLTGLGVLRVLLVVNLALSYLMTLLLLGLGLGWPLMIAAISTEDSDGFDGLSRSFGFLWDRPWHAVGLTAFGTGLFLVGRTALVAGVELLMFLFKWSSQLATPEGLQSHLFLGSFSNACLSLIAAFGPSFFFTAVTVIYFLMRQSDDGTPLTAVVDIRDEPLYPREATAETSPESSAGSVSTTPPTAPAE